MLQVHKKLVLPALSKNNLIRSNIRLFSSTIEIEDDRTGLTNTKQKSNNVISRNGWKNNTSFTRNSSENSKSRLRTNLYLKRENLRPNNKEEGVGKDLNMFTPDIENRRRMPGNGRNQYHIRNNYSNNTDSRNRRNPNLKRESLRPNKGEYVGRDMNMVSSDVENRRRRPDNRHNQEYSGYRHVNNNSNYTDSKTSWRRSNPNLKIEKMRNLDREHRGNRVANTNNRRILRSNDIVRERQRPPHERYVNDRTSSDNRWKGSSGTTVRREELRKENNSIPHSYKNSKRLDSRRMQNSEEKRKGVKPENLDLSYSSDIESLASIFLDSVERERNIQEKDAERNSSALHSRLKSAYERNKKSSSSQKEDLYSILKSTLKDKSSSNQGVENEKALIKEETKSSWRQTKPFLGNEIVEKGTVSVDLKDVEKKVKKVPKKIVIRVPEHASWSLKELGLKLRKKVKLLHEKLVSFDNDFDKTDIDEIRLNADMIELLVDDMGVDCIREFSSDILKGERSKTGPTRPPVVCIMGHVDHGKTTLLDALRNISQKNSKLVAPTEVGGITQIISAFQVGSITFLDTPGHAAFSSMRQSGNAAMDILILVIDANHKVQEQTKEILTMYLEDQEKEENKNLIVAMTKVDTLEDSSNIEKCQEKIQYQLMEYGIMPEHIQFIPISSKTGYGLQDLTEAIELQAQLMDLRSSSLTDEAVTEGIILEGRVQKGFGPIFDAVLRDGDDLKVGSYIMGVDSIVNGRVRKLLNANGTSIKKAKPSEPVRIIGLSSLPQSGETFIAFPTEKKMKSILAQKQAEKDAASDLQGSNNHTIDVNQENEDNKPICIPIILKANSYGSLNAVKDTILAIGEESHQNIHIDLISTGVGDLNSTDLELARVSEAIIFTFGLNKNVSTTQTSNKATKKNHSSSLQKKDSNKLRIYHHDIIYSLLDDAKDTFADFLPPVPTPIVHGTATVQAVFELNMNTQSSTTSTVAGLRVKDGLLFRETHPTGFKCFFNLYRKGKIIADNLTASSLKKEKDNVLSTKKNEECGLVLTGHSDFQEGDLVECFSIEMKKAFI